MNGIPIRPEVASEHASRYDLLFATITVLTVIFTVLVALMILVLTWRYHQGKTIDRSNPMTHNIKLEMLWLGIPLVLALGIFWWSSRNFLIARTPPTDAMELFVIGKQWMWHVQHPNGVRENNEMTVPIGQPIKLTMISQDVLHAMYLPEFRAQYHVVPGRYTDLWFTPTKTGTFRMLCAMHCGSYHAEMVGYVNVLSQEDYANWLDAGGDRKEVAEKSMVQKGYELYQEKRCFNCHESENTERAPSLAGIYGSQRTLETGGSILADDEYLRKAIVDPERHISSGYLNTMPDYSKQLTEEDVLNLITYMKTIGSGAEPSSAVPSDSGGSENSTDVANQGASAGEAQAREFGY